MVIKILDVDDSAQPAFIARNDAEEKYAQYWPTFSKSKQTTALKLRELARNAYFRSRTFLNARDRFIAVKIDRPQKADLLQNGNELTALNQFVIANGIEVVGSRHSLIFRLPK